MEDSVKEQSLPVVSSGNKEVKSAKLLRYPLRSASKSKDSPSIASVSASKRGKPTSTVSQSVGVLDISAKEKSAAKPPRRLSIPSKPNQVSKSVGYITPISEARSNRSGNIKGKSDTPGSDVSRSLNRKKFTVLSSASYWLSHIKLSEVAGKHQLSLGFFKLALEAGCENVQLLKDELKSYASRFNLLDLGESAKEVFKSYNISESIEQLQVSETCSHVPEEGTNSLEDDARSLSSTSKLKPRSLISSASSAAKETTQKSNFVSKIKAPMNKNSSNKSLAVETGNNKMKKNYKKPSKQESNNENQTVKTEGMKPATDEKAQLDTSPKVGVLEENKENMDEFPVKEMSLEA